MPLIMENHDVSLTLVPVQKSCNQIEDKSIEARKSIENDSSENLSSQLQQHYSQNNSISHSSLDLNSQLHHHRVGGDINSNSSSDQNLASLALNGQEYNANLNSYNESLASVSDYHTNGYFAQEGITRRGRGRPRGSKNGCGLGRLKAQRMKLNNIVECPSYTDMRLSDPYSCHKRGRPRSRFIVDLGEHNHDAWTKSKDKLKISDSELTTLLLSLLESSESKDGEENGSNVLSLASSELNKWKEKFSTQQSLFTHYASIHNTSCCTCLGLKKKKDPPPTPIYPGIRTGKRGRPRKYPPPMGYGTPIARPNMGENRNIFEPQIILKDEMGIKNEPLDAKNLRVNSLGSNSSTDNAEQPPRCESSMSSFSSNGNDPYAHISRLLTQEENGKRKDYYNSLKNEPNYSCQTCHTQFYNKSNYEFHISKADSNGKCKVYEKVNSMYLCETCGEGFTWREKLEKHLRLAEQYKTHDPKELQQYGDFQCAMCNKIYNKRAAYFEHIKWHDERNDIPCSLCGIMFKIMDLKRHLIEIHGNESNPCSHCGKLFNTIKYLEKHEAIHQAGNFPCPECGKVFPDRSTLNAHIRNHALTKDYPCEVCGQRFNQKSGICQHLKKHFKSTEFSLECELCSNCFSSQPLIRQHKNKIHNVSLDLPDDMSDPPDYLSSPISQLSDEDPREKANHAVKKMLNASLNSLGTSVNLTSKNDATNMDNSAHLRQNNVSSHRDSSQMKNSLDNSQMSRLNNMQSADDQQMHMPQDLTRMNSNPMNENERSAPQAHMNDLRSSSTDSRLSDTPAAAHMSDNFSRMAVENFGRSMDPSGYLAEHLRRMAENQSRMSDSSGHYDDRENYSRLSRGGSDHMGRLQDNLSHMGVIRPQSSASQWPAHMQNHTALDQMNQSGQSGHFYPLPFWPYDPSLRQYNH